jgi:hypothetical protein
MGMLKALEVLVVGAMVELPFMLEKQREGQWTFSKGTGTRYAYS